MIYYLVLKRGRAIMEIEFTERKLSFANALSIYDELALKFSNILNQNGIEYIFVSGYVAILFGRSRTSEDIDLLVKRISYEKFRELWIILESDFYCHNASDPETAYNDYLENRLALRFSIKDTIIPNVEFKWIHTQQQKRVFDNSLEVILNNNTMKIGSLETQIAYKLYLGTDKDIEDARYLFEIFREKLNFSVLNMELNDLEIPEEKARTDLGW
jgi:hypothetical protein